MKLRRLTLVNYKNIRSCELDFSPKINCFIGKNGMGKTNLLDAIYYLSFCKSHTNAIDSQIITLDEDFFVLQGDYEKNGEEKEIYCGLKRRQKKVFKLNKVEYEKLSDHIGLLPLVMISPSDAELISGGSEVRRRFVDVVISQYDRAYLSALIRYNSALQSRNSLLKSRVSDALMFEIYEETLAKDGEEIFRRREDFFRRFLPIFQAFYGELSSGAEAVELEYVSHLQNSSSLAEQLAFSRERDALLGYTSRGVHRDDLEFLMHKMPIKRIASQGQNKTYLIALKLAQFSFLKQINSGVKPLLLLDDIFDKLDAERVEKIMQIVGSQEFGQIFITDTNREHLLEIISKQNLEYKIFNINLGSIS